jgi:hypothetical protein
MNRRGVWEDMGGEYVAFPRVSRLSYSTTAAVNHASGWFSSGFGWYGSMGRVDSVSQLQCDA